MLKAYGFMEFAEKINDYSEIICYGAGKRILCLEDFFDDSVFSKITMVIDGDLKKKGQEIVIDKRIYNVINIDDIGLIKDGTAILITCAECLEIIDILEKNEKTFQCDILSLQYMIKIAEEDFAMNRKMPDQLRLTDEQKIPKTIHFCWFGGKPIPDQYQKYMESWRKYCPDYEIQRWDENNYDITKNKYMYEAYKHKLWALVSDYARLDIVFEYGGIYLDTDVELIRSIDDLLYQEAFAGFENKQRVNFGLGFGAKRSFTVLKKMLDYYEQIDLFNIDGTLNIVPCPVVQTEVLRKEGLIQNGEYQRVAGMTIYPEKVLSGKSYSTMRVRLAPCTHMIHHYAASWKSEKEYFDYYKKLEKLMNRFEE